MKKRIDQLLLERGLVESRTRAQALIMAGKVYAGTLRIDKPSQVFAEDAALEIKGQDHPYVSRGGLKLAAGLAHFQINPQGLICLDVGASTGGFTDVLLQQGAAKVYAVDVGTNQLDYRLRQNARVISMEKTNARNLTAEQIPESPDLIVCDASFISLKTVLPAALALAKPSGLLIALIKPQFEVGKERVGKGGVVRDAELHKEVCGDIGRWLEAEMRWQPLGLVDSPITGAEGNKEFLIAASK